MWGLERERERGKGFARKERALRERRGGRAEDEKMGSVEHDEVHSEKPEMKGGEFLQERNIF